MTIDTALDTVEQLDTEEQKQLLNIVEKRLIEKERQEIYDEYISTLESAKRKEQKPETVDEFLKRMDE
ncbi:MAG: hypothetical protein A2X61_12080 [Ignavibacteria bacterium GWB2_35_12]|nr:MAG: hypothetical protein A2X63_04705 [Ignavibacteria bacterium GWA2_35_8]OGU41997.1 MAG: hypothetical protein A2X61_12080 [Ignavibacteria bacterium GWB2_35_12]OGU87280.1 MAG: hypothetical protein A2220_01240 [Ignavibacteria bacterium RIFOXYA2_FULL_35_10]OGV24409.1 MAG: hypothetical protein A2475_12520 [Ignavibacteria bacterium RIFOXYC2_FULL_35_21]